ncbi:MAG: hypothetical protein WC197_02550 [Candidatus Gastranaerophilaceae bacterium]|jgi:hypothetical protein
MSQIIYPIIQKNKYVVPASNAKISFGKTVTKHDLQEQSDHSIASHSSLANSMAILNKVSIQLKSKEQVSFGATFFENIASGTYAGGIGGASAGAWVEPFCQAHVSL